ncbi:hypothetical protein ANO11243_038350 [Dothideomycetidae sp. 11243]|nr:hypothetical protein ANO11243_038350 [fungal sp. No.11243]
MVSSSSSTLHSLSSEQLGAFYERIRLAPRHRCLPGPDLDAVHRSQERSLELLGAIQRYAVAALPFEDLSLHYDLNHRVHLATDYVFDKVVTRAAGRGGYCMELNGLLLAVLTSLGFRVRPVGGKVNESVSMDDHSVPREKLKYSGWSHMVLIVTLPADDDSGAEEARYLFDVGFGGGNPTGPLLLRHGAQRVNIPGSDDGTGHPHVLRLVKEQVEENDMWVLERLVHRPYLPEEGEFRPFYAFTEMRFSNKDFEVMNHHVATARSSFFTYSVMVVMSVLSDDGEQVVGDVVLFNDSLKKRMYGKVVAEKKLKSEAERVEALEEWLGIKLTAVERLAISGLASEIQPY